MSNKNRQDSPLVAAVLALQNHLSELERIGEKINAIDLTGEVDLDHVQKLMVRFAECGEGITREVTNLSLQLQNAQARAQIVAQGVARQAEAFNVLRNEHNEKMEQFRSLGERVGEINTAISQFSRQQGLTTEERSALLDKLPNLEKELTSLIAELHALRDSARSSRMKALEKNAQSLAQTLQSVQTKLGQLRS